MKKNCAIKSIFILLSILILVGGCNAKLGHGSETDRETIDSLQKELNEQRATSLYNRATAYFQSDSFQNAKVIVDSIIKNYAQSKLKTKADTLSKLIVERIKELATPDRIVGICHYRISQDPGASKKEKWTKWFDADYTVEYYTESLFQRNNMKKFYLYHTAYKIYSRNQKIFKNHPSYTVVITADSRNPVEVTITVCDMIEKCSTVRASSNQHILIKGHDLFFSYAGDNDDDDAMLRTTIYPNINGQCKFFNVLYFEKNIHTTTGEDQFLQYHFFTSDFKSADE